MFLDQAISPELARELQRQRIMVAHSKAEVYERASATGNDVSSLPPTVAATTLDTILSRWKGITHEASWSVLKGMRVLDLASGSAIPYIMPSTEPIPYLVRYPHFSRLCAINGAEVIAIDQDPQIGIDRRLFTWAEVDLVSVVLESGLQNLPILQAKEFDLIHSSDFVGSNHDPSLSDQLSNFGIEVGEFEKILFKQAGGLLVENGIMHMGINEKGRILYTKHRNSIVALK